MTYKYVNHKFRPALAAGLATAAIFIFAGCGSRNARTIGGGIAPTSGQISKEDLRDRLDTFSDFFKATFRQMSTELNERVPSKRTEKTTLQMKARMVQGLNAMLDRDDPIIAFIETWALCTRFRIYLEEGEGSSLYGEGQPVAVGAARLLEGEIERIGRVFLKDDVFGSAKKNIAEFANTNPMKGTFSNVTVFATEAKRDQPDPFMSIVKLPMTPFRAMEGVDRTASAVHRFTDSTERFADIVSELPESSRWQLQLLMYDLEETEMAKSLLASMSQFAESSQRMSKAVDELPKQLRVEMTDFVKEIDSKQENLQVTLERAQKTTEAVGTALEKLETATTSVDTTAKDAAETARAWQSAAEVIGGVASEYYERSKPKDQGKSFDVKDWTVAAQQTSQTANDIKGLLAEMSDFSTAQSYNSLLNAITLRAVGFVVLIFVLAIVYRAASVRLKAQNPNVTIKPVGKGGRKR